MSVKNDKSSSSSVDSSDEYAPKPLKSQGNENETYKSEDLVEPENEEFVEMFGFPLKFGKRKWKERVEMSTVKSTSLTTSKADGALLQSIIRDSKDRQKPSRNQITQESTSASDSTEVSQNINDTCFIPTAAFTNFRAHQKSVTALTIDPTQTFLITGGNDSEVAMWDFHKMNANPKPFKRFIPVAGHSIRSLSCSFDAENFVCAAGDAIGRVYSMAGKKIQESVKGDMYVRDLAQTVGHTHTVNDCVWHPTNASRFLLASSDATIRFFDLNSKLYGVDQALPHVHILKAVDKRNLNIASKCRVTSLAVAPITAKFVIGGCSDGSLQLWTEQKIYGKPNKIIRRAHDEENDITCICILSNETQMITRSMDSTMKLWDIRLFKEPSHIWTNLPNKSPNLSACLSPHENMVATGISSDTKTSYIHVYDISGTYEIKHKFQIERVSSSANAPNFPLTISALAWPSALNQIIAGSSDGNITMFYDPVCSTEGALSFLKKPAIEDDVFETYSTTAYIPEELPPGFKQTRSGEIRKVKIRPEEAKSVQAERRVQPPLPEECQSRLGMASTMLGQLNEQDPTEALRAYAEIAEKDPVFINKAYSKTQPKTILDYSSHGGDDEKLITGVNKCPRCGLKLCQCGYMRLSKSVGEYAKKQRI